VHPHAPAAPGGNNMDPDEINMHIEKLEKRIESISNQNASLTIALNKLMMENMKLKSDIRNLEEKLMLLERPQAEKNFKME
jgi:regulator of replication initiation timing